MLFGLLFGEHFTHERATRRVRWPAKYRDFHRGSLLLDFTSWFGHFQLWNTGESQFNRPAGLGDMSFNPYAFQIRSLVAMTPHNEPHLWSPRLGVLFNEFKEEVPVHDGGVDSHQAAVYFRRSAKGRIVRTMVRQAESVFNLSQLMFALYHGQTQASTFRDLNDNRELNAQHTIQGGCHFGVILSLSFFDVIVKKNDPNWQSPCFSNHRPGS